MARIISRSEEARGAPYIELTARRNSVDPDLIVLAWRPVEGEPLAWESASRIDRDAPSGFAEREVRRVLGHADRLGISFVLIEDPEGLIRGLDVIAGRQNR